MLAPSMSELIKDEKLITLSIVRFFNSVSTCISERVFSHLEGICSDCK